MVVCDGLKGLPDAVNAVWEKTIVQTCIVHEAYAKVSLKKYKPMAAWNEDRNVSSGLL
jgi:transposase-like protein